VPYLRDLEGYQQSASGIFSKSMRPGTLVPQSGIYRCSACGYEVTLLIGASLPDEQNCPEHSPRWNFKGGAVLWRLVAAPINTNG
jgi:hypothetical protein